MDNSELKSYLHQLIDETNDTSLLKKVTAYIQTLQKENNSKNWWADISVDEKKAIKAGIHRLGQEKDAVHRDIRKKIDLILSKN